MEQNVRTLGVILATLALVASVLVMPNVSATDGDLQTTISGDEGIASYASAFGHASFTAAISSASGDAHTNVVVSAAFAEGSGWTADQATISDCTGEGTAGSHNSGDLAAALQKTKGRSTLVITERDGLAAKGAGISFKVVANRQKFEISKGNIETRKMTVGAALLSLAIVVD